jgi:hypothetical protein
LVTRERQRRAGPAPERFELREYQPIDLGHYPVPIAKYAPRSRQRTPSAAQTGEARRE